jgi:hypothetical protein
LGNFLSQCHEELMLQNLFDCYSVLRFQRQTSADQILQFFAYTLLELYWLRSYLLLQHCLVIAFPWWYFMDHFVQHNTIWKHIRCVTVLIPFQGLQTHVQWRANVQLLLLFQVSSIKLKLLFLNRKSKISQFRHLLSQQDILRLYVSVDYLHLLQFY